MPELATEQQPKCYAKQHLTAETLTKFMKEEQNDQF
jgi:hypothetical protein